MLRALSLLALTAAALMGCAGADPGPASKPDRVVLARAGRHLDPAVLEVEPGERVRWVNDAVNGEAQVAFNPGPGVPATSVTLGGVIAQFDQPGRYPYVLTARSEAGGPLGQLVTKLQGEIVVKAPVAACTAAAPPPVTPAPPPALPPAASPLPVPSAPPTAAPPPAPSVPPTTAPPPPAPSAPPPTATAPRPGPAPRPAPPGPPAATPEPLPSSPDVARVRGSRDAALALGWEPRQGPLVRIERNTVSPARLRPGERLVLELQWSVLLPSEAGPTRVRHAWVIERDGEPLTQLERELTAGNGSYQARRQLALPPDTQPGRYVVTVDVEAGPGGRVARDRSTTSFTVAP
ncbi:MAG: hypothetical protein L0027_14710 [Candidatus Rokubacteria bacterium]|nr:hypothetical protein [Candidatus Rokubacteria bacterium]